MTGHTVANTRDVLFLVMADDLVLLMASIARVAAKPGRVTGLAVGIRPLVIHWESMRSIVTGRQLAVGRVTLGTIRAVGIPAGMTAGAILGRALQAATRVAAGAGGGFVGPTNRKEAFGSLVAYDDGVTSSVSVSSAGSGVLPPSSSSSSSVLAGSGAEVTSP